MKMNKKIKNILFIEAKSPFHHIFSRTVIPRLGSVLLATILNENGYKSHVIIEDVKPFNSAMLKDVDMVGISTITSTAPRAFEIADKCRKKGIPVVIGGPHVTFLPDEALVHCDYVVRGEGEKPMLHLVNALNDGSPLDEIKGLSYRIGDKTYHNEKEDFIKDLDSLPMPDLSLIEGWDYKNVIPYATSRGCPFRCKFCSVIKMFGTKMRYHSVDRVIEELKVYSKKARHVFFCDDNFTASKSRAKQIMRRMIKENVKIEWSAQVRADAAKDEELLGLMRKTGCFAVFIGFESINQKTLDTYEKKQSVDDIKSSIDMFHKYGIKIHGMFVLGAKDDTVLTVRDTAKFANKAKIDSAQFLILTPLPGTDTYYELEKKGALITKDWRLYDSHHVVFRPENMTPYELQIEGFKALGKFYSLKNCLRHLFKLNFFYFFVNIYGVKSVRKAFKDNAQFITNLKSSLYDEAKKVKEYLLPGEKKIKRVAIPEGILSKNEQKFFSIFLKNIGIKTKFIKAKIDSTNLKKEDIALFIKTEMKYIKDKADLIIVPISEKYSEITESSLQDMGKELLSNIKNIKLLPLNEINKNLYTFCLSFGLAMDKKIKKIQKAYFLALEQAELAAA
jgi:radical SAM superfamily enzyme YgiQ (UPF0313 family)